MKKTLPEEWVSGKKNSLNVATDLGIRCPVTNLFIYRGPRKKTGKQRSKGLYCRWLPDVLEDIRPDHLKFTGGTTKGKRRSFEGTTGKEDPFVAGQIAVEWYRKQRNHLTELAQQIEYDSNHSLEHYWQEYIADFTRRFENEVGGQKRITNEKSVWNAKVSGIGHQPFAKKSIDQIVQADLKDFWMVIDAKGRKIGNSMVTQKKSIVTLINKLFTNARESRDFPHLPNPLYPRIRSVSKKEAVYLVRDEWESLLKSIIELSGGKANQLLSLDELREIPWSDRDRRNPRNFIELYDAVLMMWFYYLRAEDMPRIRTEWFTIKPTISNMADKPNLDRTALLKMEVAKGGRKLKTSEPYRPEATKAVERMLLRRQSDGYLLFPNYRRPYQNPSGSQVGDTLNTLLQFAAKQAGIDKKLVWTSLRHTAFMETLRELPELNEESKLIRFADNGYTSAKMLREDYLNKLESNTTAEFARAKLPEGSYTLFRGTRKS
mgnify:CR=1 FL=1